MHILYVTNMYPSRDHIYSGIHVKEQIDYLTRQYDIDHRLYILKGRKSKLNYLKSIFTVNWLIWKGHYDLVHIHFGISGIFLLFNPFLKMPVVVTLHGSDTNKKLKCGWLLRVTKLVVRRVSFVIIVNDSMSGLFKGKVRGMETIPCGIDIKAFDIGRNNNGPNIFKIGFPGDQLLHGKNYALFQNIVNRLRDNGYQIEIVQLHNLTREKIIRSLSELDCLLMTSYAEGSPQLIKEAVAAGLPIVSTNVGDVRLVLSNLKNCYVVDSFDPQDFIAPVIKILQLPPECRFSNGKNRLVQLKLDRDSVSQRIYKIYKSLLQVKNP